MIYLDNAATGGFKPHSVTDAVFSTVRYLCANPARSGHRLAVTGAEIVLNARTLAGELFGVDPDRVVFTKNCTEALNLAIFGTLKKGGHVITTIYEHNSVLRPLFALEKGGLISLDVVSPSPKKRLAEVIEEKINPDTYLLVTTAVSNVTGEVLPVEEIGEVAKKHNLLYLIDGAQGGGHVPLLHTLTGASMTAFAGHKGLYGIMGSGMLTFSDGLDIEPILYGGTGTESFNLYQPVSYPERLEAGTLNLPAIAGLKEGLNYVKNNFSSFSEYLYSSSARLIELLGGIDGVTCYSTPNPSGIVAFNLLNLESAEVADILNEDYDVAVRSGLHCAPLMHKYLNTDKGGLIRASLAVQNSAGEIKYFADAIKKIASR